MLQQLRAPCALCICLSACSASEPEPQPVGGSEQELLRASTFDASAWQSALPSNVSDVQVVETVRFHFCAFTVGTAVQAPPFPPQYLVWLRREAASARVRCGTGYVVLGSSYALPFVDLARHAVWPFLVASFSTKLTPSGSAHTQLRIVQPSYVTGAVLRQSSLAAMSPSPEAPSLGNVYTGKLQVALNGTLHVTGTKDGLMTPTEGLPGALNYRATYDQFLFDPSAQPTADSITTF